MVAAAAGKLASAGVQAEYGDSKKAKDLAKGVLSDAATMAAQGNPTMAAALDAAKSTLPAVKQTYAVAAKVDAAKAGDAAAIGRAA